MCGGGLLMNKNKTVMELSSDLDAHELVSLERSKNVELQFASMNARLKRLEVILMSTTGAIIIMLLSLVSKSL
jgi:hypothetical protein